MAEKPLDNQELEKIIGGIGESAGVGGLTDSGRWVVTGEVAYNTNRKTIDSGAAFNDRLNANRQITIPVADRKEPDGLEISDCTLRPRR